MDQLGYLDDAIRAARQAGQLAEDCKVISYEKLPGFIGSFFGIETRAGDSSIDVTRLSDAAVPRLWYLAPQTELAGILAAASRR